MKPTQEQIEAALSRIETRIMKADQVAEICDYAQSINNDFCHMEEDDRQICGYILAAAYRAKCEELESMREECGKHIQLYHKTSIKLETAMFGPETGEETYAKVKNQKDKLAKASLRLANIAEQNTDDTELWESVIDEVRKLAKP